MIKAFLPTRPQPRFWPRRILGSYLLAAALLLSQAPAVADHPKKSLRTMQAPQIEARFEAGRTPKQQSLVGLSAAIHQWLRASDEAYKGHGRIVNLIYATQPPNRAKKLAAMLSENMHRAVVNIGIRKGMEHLESMVQKGHLLAANDISEAIDFLFGDNGSLKSVDPEIRAAITNRLLSLKDFALPTSSQARDAGAAATQQQADAATIKASEKADAILEELSQANSKPQPSKDDFKKFADEMYLLGNGVGEMQSVLAADFPNEAKTLGDISNAANFAASVAMAGYTPYAMPGAMAQGIHLVQGFMGNGNNRDAATEALLAAIRELSRQIETYHYQEMARLGEISKAVSDLTRAYKSNELQPFELCEELLSPGYFSELSDGIPMTWTGPDLTAGRDTSNSLARTRDQCHDAIILYFTGQTPPALFHLFDADEVRGDLAAVDVVQGMIEPTRTGLTAILSDGAISRFFKPATRLDELMAKLGAVNPAQDYSKSLTSFGKSKTLDPWLTIRASGLAIALYWTIEIYRDGDYQDPDNWGRDSRTARNVLNAAETFVGISAAQQRMITGDIGIPVLRAILQRDWAQLNEFKDKHILNSNVPTEINQGQQLQEFESIRNQALCAVGSNPWLAQNMLLFDLARTLSESDSSTQISVGLSTRGAIELLPTQWRRTWAIEWRSDIDPSKAGWIAHMDASARRKDARGEWVCQPVKLEIPLPAAEAIFSGTLAQTPMLSYLEAEQAAATAEQLAVALGWGEVEGVSSALLDSVLRVGVDPTFLALH